MLYFLRIAERVQWWKGKPKKALIGVANNIPGTQVMQQTTPSTTLTRPAQSTSAR
jgi:hypothetical protein